MNENITIQKVHNDKIATNIEKFELLGESPISIQFDVVDKDTLSKYFIKNNGKFHKSCNNKFSDLKLERAEKRSRIDHQPEILPESDVNDEQEITETFQTTNRRSSLRACTMVSVEPSKCLFCDKTDGTLRKVMTFDLEKRVRKCAVILNDNALLGKLSSGDLIAQEAVYHPICLLSLYRNSEKKTEDEDTSENEFNKLINAQVFAELAQYMEQEINDGTKNVFKLVDLADLYKQRVKELGGHTSERVHTTKLKQRLLAHVENLRENSDKKFVYLTFEKNIGNVLKNSYGKTYDDEAFILSEAAKILRRDVLSNPSTDFNGCFLEDCQDKFVPQSVKSFIDQVLQGNIINDSHRGLEQATLTIGQLLIHNSVKRVRQNKGKIKHRRSTDRESP